MYQRSTPRLALHLSCVSASRGGRVAKLIDRIKTGQIDAPAAKLIGFRLTAVEQGSAVFELEAGPPHRNPSGTLTGGVLCHVAHAASGCCYASARPDGESFTTLELDITFL